jgi:neurotransmitter:Na+ symporter, NSS family
MASRGGFSSRLGFVAAAAGAAVGLGNIWKFPYETGDNGGAAFLVVYFICTFLIGFPIMVAEIALGRKTQANAYGAYKGVGNKTWGLAGLFGILCGIMILSFYNVVAGWSFGYFLQLVFGDLLESQNFGQYFGAYVSDISDNIIFSLAFMLCTAIIVVRGIQQGIESASKILMPFLFFILIGLIVYGLTLPNAMDGVKFYLVPDLSQINFKTIYTATGQAFFSLSLGMGGLITYGSYFSKKDNIISSAVIVTIADTAVAFLAGFMIFPLVFSQGQAPTEGPGLVFVALPGIFQGMGPVMGKVIGGSFFLLLCFAALTSTISLLEVPVAYFVDEKKWPRKVAVFVLAGLIFLLGLPSMLSVGAVDFLTNLAFYEGTTKSFLDIVADVFSDVGLVLGGFLLSVFIAIKWKAENMTEEISLGSQDYKGSLLEKYINFMVTKICPFVLGFIFFVTVIQKFTGIEIF